MIKKFSDKTDDADLSGGFFDSSGSMKFTFSIAHSVTMLTWAVLGESPMYVCMYFICA